MTTPPLALIAPTPTATASAAGATPAARSEPGAFARELAKAGGPESATAASRAAGQRRAEARDAEAADAEAAPPRAARSADEPVEPAPGEQGADAAPGEDEGDAPADAGALLAAFFGAAPEPRRAAPAGVADSADTAPAAPDDGALSGAGNAALAAADLGAAPGSAGRADVASRADAEATRPGQTLPAADASALAHADAAALQAAAAPPAARADVTALPATGTAAATPRDAQVTAPLHAPGFSAALGTQLSTLVRDGVQHARLQLNPAEMGPIAVQIALDGQQAQVHMSAEHAATRQVLEQAMPALAGALREHGLTLTGGGVFEQAPQRRDDEPGGGGPGGRDGRDGRDGRRDDDGGGAEAPRAPARVARGVVDLYA